MVNKEDAYQVLGTRKIFVEVNIKGKVRDDSEKDQFIKEKAEYALKMIDIKYKNPNRSAREKKELEEKAKEILDAYEKVRNKTAREIYDAMLQEAEKEKQEKTIRIKRNPDAYRTLGFSRTQCSNSVKSDGEIDSMIQQRKNSFLTLLEDQIKKANFKEGQKLELQIAKIEEDYEKIKDAEARKSYNLQLDHLEEKRLEQERQSRLKLKYDKSQYYNESFLDRSFLPKHTTQKNPVAYTFFRHDGKPVEIAHIGDLYYRNGFGVFVDSVEEYAVTRMVKGEKRTDIVYTNLSMLDMSINPKTRIPIANKEYYNYVMGEVLSEDSIEACKKYNAGYLGEILESGRKYYTSFDDKERLTAIMKFHGYRDKKNQQLGGSEK